MNKTIGILAHVDAGKTTLSEQLLYHTKSIRTRGRVDHKDAFLDSHDIERERGITIFSDLGMMSYKDSNYYLIDTPGHVDFSAEMERAIQVMDYAIVIISAVEGVEGHTETVWHLLRKHKIPTFFFINKIDRVGADIKGVLEELRLSLSENIYDITRDFNDGDMKEGLIEFIAERRETLIERYIEDGYNRELWLKNMISMIKENTIFPAFSGSALQDVGIVDFLEALDTLTTTDYNNKGDFGGRVYKIHHDNTGTRLTFIKALSGNLRIRDELCYGDDDNRICEKITQIRKYSGSKFKTVDEVRGGEVFAVTGLSEATPGIGVGNIKEVWDYEMIPTLKSKVIFEPSVNSKDALKAFKILNLEDPSLNVTWDETLQEIHIQVMGVIGLEVLKEIIKQRFGYTVTFDEPQILYKETIDGMIKGYGHFEPLGHYAEVHLSLEGTKRNSGISFKNMCHIHDLSIGHQNLIKHHVFERDHNGLLTGSPLTDIKITLLTGRSHNRHTSGGDFREATYRALRQGLEKAKNVLLEPYYNFKIKVELDHMGRVISDIQNAHGEFNPPRTMGNKVTLTGRVPVATFMNYSKELASFTGGKGSLSLVFSGYYPCHNQEEVIKKIGYNKDADPKYTSYSIFCSKGQSYRVTWEEVEDSMHCLR